MCLKKDDLKDNPHTYFLVLYFLIVFVIQCTHKTSLRKKSHKDCIRCWGREGNGKKKSIPQACVTPPCCGESGLCYNEVHLWMGDGTTFEVANKLFSENTFM